MKIWMFLLSTILMVFVSTLEIHAEPNEHFYVQVELQNNKTISYSIYSPNEYIALTYVEAQVKLDPKYTDIRNISVRDTKLDYSSIPEMEFEINGSKGDRTIFLHTIDSKVGIRAIQHALRRNFLIGLGEVKEIRMTDDLLSHRTCQRMFSSK